MYLLKRDSLDKVILNLIDRCFFDFRQYVLILKISVNLTIYHYYIDYIDHSVLSIFSISFLHKIEL